MDDNKYLNPFDDPEFTKEVKIELQKTFDRCISKYSSETELGKPIFIGEKMVEYEEICDKCPYMRIVCLDKDYNIVFIE